jgi:DNA polymerase-3 subunit beta
MTRLVLVNAIYFKGSWENAFYSAPDHAFHLPGGGVNAQMITRTDHFAYAQGAGYQVVDLPYVGGTSMTIILPDVGQFDSFEASLSAGKVEFELKDEGLEVKSNDQETILRGMPASEFPLLPKLVKNHTLQMKASDLRVAIGRVVFAVSLSESRPELSGVACFFNPPGRLGKVAYVATDSYRLAEQIVTCSDANRSMSIIVPGRAMSEIQRIISAYKNDIAPPDDLSWSMTDNQLVVSYGTVELTTRLIEAAFPDYQNIIPTAFKTNSVLSRNELLKTVKAASIFSKKEINDVHLKFDPAAGSCAVESSDEGTGKTKSTLKGEVSGDPNEVALNFKYLADGLNAFEGEKIKLSLIGSMSPVMLLPAEGEMEYRYLVMPIRQ